MSTPAPTPVPNAERTRLGLRWFSTSIAIGFLLLMYFAFAPALLDPSGRNTPLPLTPIVVAHTLVASAWLFLFLVQTTLIATARVPAHRRLGILGATLGLAFVVTGYFTVIEQARRGFDLSGDLFPQPVPPDVDVPSITVGALFLIATFGILFCAALLYRHRPAVHKRLMLMAVIGGLTATPTGHLIGHLQVPDPWAVIAFPASLLILIVLIAVHDRLSEGRIHPVTLWVGSLVFVSQGLFVSLILPSSLWQRFSMWLIS